MSCIANHILTVEIEKRFWSKVEKRGEDDCWEWKAHRSKKGYGQFQFANRLSCPATHVAMKADGRNRPKGLIALHSCDNPPCCNPKHLRWGTAGENAADRDTRGRGNFVRGESHGEAKLSSKEVISIFHSPQKQSVLASEYGVSQALVSNIKRGKAWRHLTEAIGSSSASAYLQGDKQ